jgi:hypothetical protein
MENELQKALTAAVQQLLKPLVRILLRHGMPYGTFAELCRKAFVDTAFEDTTLSGKRPNISSVSALTGLTRKETKRLKEWDMTDSGDSAQRYSRAIRVISGWVETPDFHDEGGKPAELPLEGDNRSFANLVRRFSGDIPTAAMLSVLESSGCVATVGDSVQLLERAYIPKGTTVDRVNILGTDVAELAATIGHNLDAQPEDRLFQRKVSNVLVRKDALPAFREYSNRKSQALLEDYHQWLTAHEVTHNDEAKAGEESCYAAVGIYYTENSATGEDLK